jgi:diguanylate cyclase
MSYKTTKDLLELVNTVIEGKLLFVGKIQADTFTVMETLDNNTGINLPEKSTFDLKESYCQQIYFGNREPMIINDSFNHAFTSNLNVTRDLNIHSYIGVPIFYNNGEMYGTLCAVDSKTAQYTEKDIDILVKFSNLFSYVIELEKQMTLDILTGLLNRNYLFNHFDYMSNQGSILLLDLDGFKQVNDKYGHDVGDLVLIEVGNRIRQTIDHADLAIRFGGDEFVIILPNQTDSHLTAETARKLTNRLADWSNFDYPIHVSASIGIVPFPQEGNDLRSLLKKADSAMYQAKLNGKNTFQIYSELDAMA